jgi:hypothetical protein
VRAVTLVWEECNEARDDGGLRKRDESKTFAFGDCVWGVLMMWGKEDVLDGAGVQDGAQQIAYSNYRTVLMGDVLLRSAIID